MYCYKFRICSDEYIGSTVNSRRRQLQLDYISFIFFSHSSKHGIQRDKGEYEQVPRSKNCVTEWINEATGNSTDTQCTERWWSENPEVLRNLTKKLRFWVLVSKYTNEYIGMKRTCLDVLFGKNIDSVGRTKNVELMRNDSRAIWI